MTSESGSMAKSAAKQNLQLILNANIYAPEFLGLKNILIGAGKILAISSEQIELPNHLDVEITDIEGKRLLPGFIDCHAHITGGGGENGFSSQVAEVPIDDFTSVGVTTVVGLLGTDDTTRSTENLVAKVYALRELGMSAYCWTGGYHLPLTTLTGSAKKDMVFIEPVIGIGEFAISDHRSSQATFEEVIRLASEAHVAGLLTGKAGVIHFHLGDGERKVELIQRALTETEIPPRTFHATHVNRNIPLFNDCCGLLEQGCYIDITAFPKATAEPGIEADQAVLELIKLNLPLSQVTISSDGGGCLPCFNAEGEITHMDTGSAETLLQTLQSLLAADQDLAKVLPLFTENVATLLRFKNKGRIDTGYDADLIILDKDNQISDVMGGGRWFVQQGKPTGK